MKAFAVLLVAALAGVSHAHYHGGHGDWDSGRRDGHYGHGGPGCGSGEKSTTAQPATTTARPTTTTIKPAQSGIQIETKSLVQLYNDAKAAGCHLIVYAGGDTAGQQDGMKEAFEKRFAGCIADIIVDYSKFHSARIDFQISQKKLIPDVVQLQTLQDFPRWKSESRFLNYKVRGWDQIYDQFKDPEGAFFGIFVDAFTNCINQKMLPNKASWPRNIKDYLKPELKGHITITYPNDDDAVLYLFYRFAQTHGSWDFLVELQEKQNINWVRGTQEPVDALLANRTWVTPAVDCDMHANDMSNPSNSNLVFALPTTDYFLTWAQQAAIFKTAKNPASAKLYLNWLLDADTQQNNWSLWSSRKDVPAPGGYKSVFDYPKQTNPTDFLKFMTDRALVERTKSIVTQIIGEPQGPPSPGNPGLYPTKALPH